MLKLVLLEDIYGCGLSVNVAKSFFGRQSVSEFMKSHKDFEIVSGYIIMRAEKSFSDKRIKDCIRQKGFSTGKLEKARHLLRYLKYIPWIRFAAVSGSVSFMSADEDDDIDIFLVTARNRLWITRAFELILFRMLGVRRRYSDTDVRDRICINYYITEDSLDLKKSRGGSFFTALEILMMKPVYKGNYYQRLLSANTWVKEFFPGITIEDFRDIDQKRIVGISFVIDVLDRIAMWLQIVYMKMMKHPYKKSKLDVSEVRFFPPDGWDKREKMLQKRLELYDLR